MDVGDQNLVFNIRHQHRHLPIKMIMKIDVGDGCRRRFIEQYVIGNFEMTDSIKHYNLY